MPIIENISWGNTKLSKAQIIDFGLKLDWQRMCKFVTLILQNLAS
jgi:hypothetical protein